MEKKYYSFLAVDKTSGIGVAEGVVSKNHGVKEVSGKNVFSLDLVAKNVAKKLNYALGGELKEDESTFMRVSFWEGLADRASKVLDKGAVIEIFGKFQAKSYEGKNGKVNYVEIQARDFKIVKFAKKDEESVANTNQENAPAEDDGDMPF